MKITESNRINEILNQINRNLKEINEKVEVGNENADSSIRQTIHHCGENIQRLFSNIISHYKNILNDKDTKHKEIVNQLNETYKNEINALNQKINEFHEQNQKLEKEKNIVDIDYSKLYMFVNSFDYGNGKETNFVEEKIEFTKVRNVHNQYYGKNLYALVIFVQKNTNNIKSIYYQNHLNLNNPYDFYFPKIYLDLNDIYICVKNIDLVNRTGSSVCIKETDKSRNVLIALNTYPHCNSELHSSNIIKYKLINFNLL